MERAIAFELRVQRLSTVIVVRHFLPFLLPFFFPDLVIRSLLLASHAQPVGNNFAHKEPTACKPLSIGCAFWLAMVPYIPCTDAHIQC